GSSRTDFGLAPAARGAGLLTSLPQAAGSRETKRNSRLHSQNPAPINRQPSMRPRAHPDARVAQLVEQRIENPRVTGSIPVPGTTFSLWFDISARLWRWCA